MHILLLAALVGATGGNLLGNPGFEQGWSAWGTANGWYEAGGPGKGNGISAWELDDKVAHSGKCSVRVQGKRNRGIALQTLAGYSDRFRLSGWVRTEGLNAGTAFLLAEFKTRDGSFLGGSPVPGISGTKDWTFVSGEVVAPPGTRRMSVNLLTSDPNEGTAWFDDISFEDVTHDTQPPAPVHVRQAPAGAGWLGLRWDPKAAEPDVLRYEVFVSERPFLSVQGMQPRAVVDCDAGEAVVEGVRDGRPCYVRVVAVDRDGNRLPEGASVRMVPQDTRPPRPVAVEALPVLARKGAVLVRWHPSRLDADLAAFDVLAGPQRRLVPPGWRELLVADTGTGGVRVSVAALDGARNWGPAATARVEVPEMAAAPAQGLSGTVTAAGRPLAGATVRAVGPDGSHRQAVTDGDGHYALRLAAVAPRSRARADALKPHRVSASAPGYLDSADTRVLLEPGEGAVVDLALSTPSADLAAWSVSPLDNVFPDAPAPGAPTRLREAERGAPRPAVDWLAVRGETEGAQVVLRGTVPFAITGVECAPLEHPAARKGRVSPAPHVRAAVVGTFFANKNSTATPPELLLRKAPADFPDPFLEGFPQAVPAGVSRPIYLMVDVPRGAAPGEYRGTARIEVRVEGRGPAQVCVPIRLVVAPVTLPKHPTLPVTHWFEPGNFATWHKVEMWSEPFWDLLRVYARDLAQHRQTVVMVPLDIIGLASDGGRLRCDFARFDRWVKLFTAEGVGQRLEIMHCGSREHGEWEDKTFVLHRYTATDGRTGEQMLVGSEQIAAAIQQHLIQKGWLGRAMLHIADEPIAVNVASWRQISREVHASAPKLRRLDAIHVPPEEVKGDLEVMVPQLNYFDQWHGRFLAAQKQGAEVWFYIAWVPQGKYPNRLMDYPAIKTRIIPWMVQALGANGYLHWGYNYWTPGLADVGFAPGDNWIVYPGTDGPRSCLRWEAFRDGLEDLELFRMLAARDPAEARAMMSHAVRSATDYETDPARLEAVRRQVIADLAGR